MRHMAVLVAVPLAVVLLGPVPTGWAAASPVTYKPPVDAAVTDPFRPPAERWRAGNRGVDYDTEPGGTVAASADGEVVFAGQVGGKQHVVVLHADGVRTSYSFLRSTSVRRGDRVGQGQTVGTSDDSFHFGARIGDAYVDPTLLFGDGLPEVYLVPDGDLAKQSGTEAQERTGLLRQLATAIADGGAAASSWASDQVDGVLDELRGVEHYGIENLPLTHARRLVGAARDWMAQRENCTASSVTPPRLAERHIAVLVGGLGSSTDKADIADVDTQALGFAPADVHRFSYRGGAVPEPDRGLDAAALPSSDYGATDTTVDMRESARRLHDLLEATAAAHPGVPIDVLAHSQGGLVARAALAYEDDPGGAPRAASLVTLATPHQGTDLATAGAMFGKSVAGNLAQQGVSTVMPFDLQGTSVRQMAEMSSFIRGLESRPLPSGVKVTSIG
ncbi:MAG: hypothetical protein QOJ69_16, partial [Actinomycetota bacterium]|nr:hypothetical protein [Actinomycetota bacterium]